jgi:hypothetical protein
MGREKKDVEVKAVKKSVSVKKPVSFTTKDGKPISFVNTGKRSTNAGKTIKALEKRLSAMEKAVIKYNKDAVRHKEGRKQQVHEEGKHGKQVCVGKAPRVNIAKKNGRAFKTQKGETASDEDEDTR